MAYIDVPVLVPPSVEVVKTRAFSGPYGHLSESATTLHVGDFLTGLLGSRVGVIDGYTESKGTPNVPLACKVRLLRERDGMVVRETRSNPVTGYFRFTELADQETYFLLAHYPDRTFRAVAADNLSPEVPAV